MAPAEKRQLVTAWSLFIIGRKSLFSGNSALSLSGRILPAQAAQLPALSALMPFLLLAMVCVKLHLPDPSQVFGLMLLLLILLMGLVRYRQMDALCPVALASVLLVEYAWYARSFNPQAPGAALGW
jgi:hypothetical protein